jgi:hypothetical protein
VFVVAWNSAWLAASALYCLLDWTSGHGTAGYQWLAFQLALEAGMRLPVSPHRAHAVAVVAVVELVAPGSCDMPALHEAALRSSLHGVELPTSAPLSTTYSIIADHACIRQLVGMSDSV